MRGLEGELQQDTSVLLQGMLPLIGGLCEHICGWQSRVWSPVGNSPFWIFGLDLGE